MAVTPNDWDSAAHELWLQQHRVEAIQAVFMGLNSHEKKPKSLLMQAGFYLFFTKDYAACSQILEHGLALYPNDKDMLQTLIVALSRLGQHQPAKRYAEAMVATDPDNYNVWDSLASIYHKLGELKQASSAGQKALMLKDAAHGAKPKDWPLPRSTPQAYCEGKKRVISFSLWGDNERYLRGALRNALLAPDIYPGWEIRFYTDNSVPSGVIDALKKLGADVVLRSVEADIKDKLCWRFDVCNDADIGYFLVRDVDSVISLRERYAVDAWLESGQWFHIIRDWWTHTDLMLAGLWGGVAGVLPDISNMLTGYQSNNVETPNIDQWFLRDCIWGYVKPSVLIHDRCFAYAKALPMPSETPAGSFHVGCCEYTQRKAFQAQLLGPWLAVIDTE